MAASSRVDYPAEMLLGVPADEPERIFVRDELRRQYGVLLKAWLPGVNRGDPRASAVFMHLKELYTCAVERRDTGSWRTPGLRRFRDAGGTVHDVRYRVRRMFELGEMLVGDETVAFLLDPPQRDLFSRAHRTLGAFPFANDRMRVSLRPALPRIVAAFEVAGSSFDAPNRLALIIRKPSEYLLLADVLSHGAGRLDARHGAWILSRLHNIACWLQYARISHGAISPDTVFVSPSGRAVALLGGWWYATPYGTLLAALPTSTAAVIASNVLRGCRGDPRIDPALIRQLARVLLAGAQTGHSPRVHPKLASWLRLESAGNACADYAQWEHVRSRAFGPRRYVPFSLAADDLYPPAFLS
jgi:hypothetical protein